MANGLLLEGESFSQNPSIKGTYAFQALQSVYYQIPILVINIKEQWRDGKSHHYRFYKPGCPRNVPDKTSLEFRDDDITVVPFLVQCF